MTTTTESVASRTPKHYPAAFINSIAEEGTKDEAVGWLQRIWNERCTLELEAADLRSCIKDLRERLAKAREEVMQEWAATFERDADGYAATGFTEDHYCVAVRRECARQLRMCIADEAELRALKQKGADHE